MYKCTRKYNLNVHKRNKHEEDLTTKLNDTSMEYKKTMENESLRNKNNDLRKIKMMLKNLHC